MKAKYIGLVLAAIWLAGALVPAAQAGTFTVSGVSSGSESLVAGVSLTSSGVTFTVAESFSIKCSGLAISGGSVNVGTHENSATALAFSGCGVLGPKGEATTCKVKNTGGTNGSLSTGSVTGRLTTVVGTAYDVFRPVSGSFFNSEITGCASFEGTYGATGSLALKVLTPLPGELEKDVAVESSATTGGPVSTGLFVGGKATTFDIKMDLALNSGRAWGMANPKFTVEGVPTGSEGIVEKTTVTSSTVTLTVPNLFSISCSSLAIVGGAVKAGGHEISATSLKLSGCSVKGPKGEASACIIKSVGSPFGTMATGSVVGTLDNTNGAIYDDFTPVAANFMEFMIDECALEGKYKLTGTFPLKVVSPALGGVATTVEFESSQAITEAAGTHLLYGAREMFLDAKLDLNLSSDKSWGVDP